MWCLLIFSLTTLALSALAISYGIAYRLKPTISVLSLFLFILTVWFRQVVLTLKVINTEFDIGMVIGGENIRSLMILITATFFLYTTWRENK